MPTVLAILSAEYISEDNKIDFSLYDNWLSCLINKRICPISLESLLLKYLPLKLLEK